MACRSAQCRHCQQLQRSLFVLARTSDDCTPYTVAKRKLHTFTQSSQNCNKGHGLDTPERQTNGMLISSIFSVHKMTTQAPPDVTSLHSACTSACVQMAYSPARKPTYIGHNSHAKAKMYNSAAFVVPICISREENCSYLQHDISARFG